MSDRSLQQWYSNQPSGITLLGDCCWCFRIIKRMGSSACKRMYSTPAIWFKCSTLVSAFWPLHYYVFCRKRDCFFLKSNLGHFHCSKRGSINCQPKKFPEDCLGYPPLPSFQKCSGAHFRAQGKRNNYCTGDLSVCRPVLNPLRAGVNFLFGLFVASV